MYQNRVNLWQLYFVPARDVIIQGKLNWHFGTEVIQHSAFSEISLLVNLSLAYTNPSSGWTFQDSITKKMPVI